MRSNRSIHPVKRMPGKPRSFNNEEGERGKRKKVRREECSDSGRICLFPLFSSLASHSLPPQLRQTVTRLRHSSSSTAPPTAKLSKNLAGNRPADLLERKMCRRVPAGLGDAPGIKMGPPLGCVPAAGPFASASPLQATTEHRSTLIATDLAISVDQ